MHFSKILYISIPKASKDQRLTKAIYAKLSKLNV